MRRMTRGAALVLALAGLVGTAEARVIWRGDFETGDVSQWSSEQSVSFDRLKVKKGPVRQGRYALEVTVRPGDNPIRASGNRNELVFTDDDPAGEERVYAWSTLWPEGYVSAPTWQLFTQWHHSGNGGSPPVEFYVNDETVYLRVSGEVLWTAPLERGRWHDFVFRVKWATNGWVELLYDGASVLDRTPARTLFPGQGVYLKQGLYRNASVRHVQKILHDGMTVATALEDVLPTPAPLQPSTPVVPTTPAVANTAPQVVSASAPASEGQETVAEESDSTEVDPVEAGCEAVTGTGGVALLGLLSFARRRRRSVA
jgi:hypothetical protein